MSMTGNKRKIRAGNVVALHETEPLLKTVGYPGLLNLITPEELAEAKELLADFVNNMPDIDNNKFALAYLFGVLQGTEETINDLSKSSGLGLIQRLKEAHELGRKLGIVQAMVFSHSKENE